MEKKIGLIIKLSLIIILLLISQNKISGCVFADEFQEDSLVLTEEKIKYLSDSDFTTVYEELEANKDFEKMSIEKINVKIISRLIEIADSNSKKRGYFGSPFTSGELKLLVNPLLAYEAVIVNNAATIAQNTTMDKYKRNWGDDSSDAFRHAYWNSSIVLGVHRKTGASITRSREIAKVWTDAHESDTTNKNEKTMDLTNNGIGRNAVDKNRSDADMAAIIYNKVNQGEMIIITPTVWRVYLWQNGGQHFYTKNQEEYKHLVRIGAGRGEGIAWHFSNSGDDVYRLYNPNASYHFYTKNITEKNSLVSLGWQYEGVGFKSNGSYPVYRLYNLNTGKHFFTTNLNEKNAIQNSGWRYELALRGGSFLCATY
ncbi:MAG: hypothetical protein LBS41_02245 [Streptococcaceae bacterium]|jgi:hypothetical protein|nr:hypothetical protein [Streptococcaceae bacterium]